VNPSIPASESLLLEWFNLKENAAVQPCEELQKIVLQHYGKFGSDGQLESVTNAYSRLEGVTIIGNDPYEWFEDSDSIAHFIEAGGASKLDIQVENIKAYCEGTVGWTADRVRVRLPNGDELPVRHTRIFHKENDAWKIVHLHVSIAVPNEQLA
jgi:hypothetical protein